MVAKLAVGPVPLYYQLEQDLSGRIAVGEFNAGAPLPTEEQIGRSYGVSRITVRKALGSLLEQGVIVRRRGVGSFVAEQGADVHLVHLSGSLDAFLHAAHQTTPHVLSLSTTDAPSEIAQALEVRKGAPVLRLELVSFGSDGPIAYCDFFFPEMVIGRIDREMITRDVTIMKLVERQIGIKVARATLVIEADLAGATISKHLELPCETPVLRTLRTYYTVEGRPIEVAQVHHHPQRYRYEVELRSRPLSI